MGVDADGLLAETIAEDDIGCLTADAGEADEVCEIVGNFTAEALDQLHATVVNRFGFVAVEIDFADLRFQIGERQLSA